MGQAILRQCSACLRVAQEAVLLSWQNHVKVDEAPTPAIAWRAGDPCDIALSRWRLHSTIDGLQA